MKTFANNGASILYTEDGVVKYIHKPYSVAVNVIDGEVSVRNQLTSVTAKYSEVSSPVTASATALGTLIDSWLDGVNSGFTFTLGRENADIAGQVKMGLPTPLGDYRFTKDLNTRYFSGLANGAGAITHDATDAAANLAVTNNNDWALISTFQSHPYFAGFPIDFEFTTIGFNPQSDVEKEVVYGDRTFSAYTGKDGIVLSARNSTHYLEVWKSGNKLLEVPRAQWNDPMDGTGASGLNLGDFSAFCVFSLQWLWLGGAGVGLICYYGGGVYLAHALPWAYVKSTIIISNPQKPIQAGIISTGGAGSFKFICSTVKTLGVPSLEVGEERAIMTANAGVTLAGAPALTGVLFFKLGAGYRNSVIEPVDISVSPEGASDVVRWHLIMNPTIAGAAPTYAQVDTTDSFERALGATTNTITNGYTVAAAEASGRVGLTTPIKTPRRIGWTLAGVADVWCLAVEPLTGGSITVNATIRIRQRY